MVVLKVLQEFAGGTSIHGFGFLVSHKKSKRSKIIVAISLVVAVIYASAEMRNSVISKYQYLFQNHKIEANDFLNTINGCVHLGNVDYKLAYTGCPTDMLTSSD